MRHVESLPFESFQFHGFTGKRRVVSFGWRYDFNESELQKAESEHSIPAVDRLRYSITVRNFRK